MTRWTPPLRLLRNRYEVRSGSVCRCHPDRHWCGGRGQHRVAVAARPHCPNDRFLQSTGVFCQMIYETQDDHAHKCELATIFARVYKCDVTVLPCLSPMDVIFSRGELKLYAEIKRRYNDRTKYPTLMMDKAKLDWCVENRAAGIAVIEWNDCTGWISLRAPHTVGQGGRRDRNDKNDIDTCAFYPVDKFEIFLRCDP